MELLCKHGIHDKMLDPNEPLIPEHVDDQWYLDGAKKEIVEPSKVYRGQPTNPHDSYTRKNSTQFEIAKAGARERQRRRQRAECEEEEGFGCQRNTAKRKSKGTRLKPRPRAKSGRRHEQSRGKGERKRKRKTKAKSEGKGRLKLKQRLWLRPEMREEDGKFEKTAARGGQQRGRDDIEKKSL